MIEGLTIAYTCNIRPKETEEDARYGEWESEETINAVTKSFEKTGNRVILLDADKDIYHKLLRHSREIDIVFNNAEGFKEAQLREARVPFFCDDLGIPYSGSGAQALINTMDKATAKEILKNYGIRTPLFVVLDKFTARLERDLAYPLMVKPVSEGTSIGITQKSKVYDSSELEKAVRAIIREYQQPALVEEFVGGNEYTVGNIGNRIMPILKIPFNKIPGKPVLRDPHIKDIENPYIEVMRYGEEGYRDLAMQTEIAFEALGCDDYCRMDWRKGKDGHFYFLEANPLPGIHPTEADLTNMARHAGIKHDEMINWILWEAIKRNRADKKYQERFTEEKIRGIGDYVHAAKSKLRLYEQESKENGEYRLVKAEEKNGKEK